MKIVERANVQLRIQDEELERYINDGFEEIQPMEKEKIEVKETKKK